MDQAIISLVVQTKLLVLKTDPDTEFKMVRGQTIKILIFIALIDFTKRLWGFRISCVITFDNLEISKGATNLFLL